MVVSVLVALPVASQEVVSAALKRRSKNRLPHEVRCRLVER